MAANGDELLHQILTAILDGTYESDEEFKLEIYESISRGMDNPRQTLNTVLRNPR
jgi:hypothetical protein